MKFTQNARVEDEKKVDTCLVWKVLYAAYMIKWVLIRLWNIVTNL